MPFLNPVELFVNPSAGRSLVNDPIASGNRQIGSSRSHARWRGGPQAEHIGPENSFCADGSQKSAASHMPMEAERAQGGRARDYASEIDFKKTLVI